MTWEQYAAAWSRLHGGFDPARASILVRGWLRSAYTIGLLLGRLGVAPLTVTLAGLALNLAVPAAVLAGPPGLLLAGLLVLLAGVADGLDGAVAVLTDRTSRAGYVYDSVVDRLGELAWLTALWLAGAPGWLAVAAGAASWLHEYVRARATGAGMPDIGAVTVGERPTRVAVAVTGLLLGGAAGLVRPDWLAPAMTVAAAVWLTLQAAGLMQLARALRKAFD